MTFEQFWEATAARNKWQPDARLECSVEGVRKLCEQAYQRGKEQTEASHRAMEKLRDSLRGATRGPLDGLF
jgi:hypothetical protein